jgi:hypothetical protein
LEAPVVLLADFHSYRCPSAEASLPSIEIAKSSGDAGIDTKLDRISLVRPSHADV